MIYTIFIYDESFDQLHKLTQIPLIIGGELRNRSDPVIHFAMKRILFTQIQIFERVHFSVDMKSEKL